MWKKIDSRRLNNFCICIFTFIDQLAHSGFRDKIFSSFYSPFQDYYRPNLSPHYLSFQSSKLHSHQHHENDVILAATQIQTTPIGLLQISLAKQLRLATLAIWPSLRAVRFTASVHKLTTSLGPTTFHQLVRR